MTGYFLQQALNNAWANATLYGALKGVSRDVFTAPRPGFFPSISATLNHIHAVDLYYVDALLQAGQGRAVYERAEVEEIAALGHAQAEVDMALAGFCRDLTTAQLSAPRQTERADGPTEERIDRLLLHLFQHQIHHRGQAHVQLSHAGIAPPQLDDFYLDYDRAPSAAAYWA